MSYKVRNSGWTVDEIKQYKPRHWIIKVDANDSLDEDFKQQMKDFVIEHAAQQGKEEPAWIQLQFSTDGKIYQKYQIYKFKTTGTKET